MLINFTGILRWHLAVTHPFQHPDPVGHRLRVIQVTKRPQIEPGFGFRAVVTVQAMLIQKLLDGIRRTIGVGNAKMGQAYEQNRQANRHGDPVAERQGREPANEQVRGKLRRDVYCTLKHRFGELGSAGHPFPDAAF